MLELARTDIEVIVCLAPPGVLDGLATPPGVAACRVARDELMLVAPRGAGLRQTLAGAQARVVEQSAAWSALALSGTDADRAFSRLSAIPLPGERPAFLQGAIAGVPGKALVEDGRILVLVSSVLGHHLRERARAACQDLRPVETGG